MNRKSEPQDARPFNFISPFFQDGQRVTIVDAVPSEMAKRVFQVRGYHQMTRTGEVQYTLMYYNYHRDGGGERFIHGVDHDSLRLAPPRGPGSAKYREGDQVTCSTQWDNIGIINHVQDEEDDLEITYYVTWRGRNELPGGYGINATRELEHDLKPFVEDVKPSIPAFDELPEVCPKCRRLTPFLPRRHKLGRGESFSDHPILYKHAIPKSMEYLTWECAGCGYDDEVTRCADDE